MLADRRTGREPERRSNRAQSIEALGGLDRADKGEHRERSDADPGIGPAMVTYDLPDLLGRRKAPTVPELAPIRA
jgi:hypothetical protein